jgi:hypothetical protein
MKNYLLIILIGFGLVGCTKLEDPDNFPNDQKLTLTARTTSLISGGADTTTITVRVPKDAGVIPVSFSTTAGTFLYSAAKTDKENTDDLDGGYRYATTVLKTDTSHGTVYITASATTVQTRITLNFK